MRRARGAHFCAGAVLLCLALLASAAQGQRPGALGRARPARTPAAQAQPAGKPSLSMARDPSSFDRVSGLCFSVQDAGWPTLSMYGAVGRAAGYLGPVAFEFGTVACRAQGELRGEDVSWATNVLQFSAGEGGAALRVYITRLSPAALVESEARELSFFGKEPKPATKWYIGPQYARWWQQAKTIPAGAVRPLRWAAPGADGRVHTGVLARQDVPEIPEGLRLAGAQPVPSLAEGRYGAPPLEALGESWLLLWYGSDSRFGATKVPFVDWKVKASRPRLPFWPVDGSAFLADVPLLLVFQRAPSAVRLDAQRGLVFSFAGPAGRVALLPLFGHVAQYAEDTERWLAEFPQAVARRCAVWARRLGQFPVSVSEEVSYDAREDRVVHREEFQFLALRAGAERYAPLPPMVALARRMGVNIEVSGEVEDEPLLATLFGPVALVRGGSYSWAVRGLGRYVRGELELGPSTERSAALERELCRATDEVLAAGHLAPLFYMFVSSYKTVPRMPQGTRYWTDPSETLYLLAELLPVLPEDRRAALRKYLRAERRAFPPETMLMVDRQKGARREHFSVPRSDEWVSLNDRWNKKDDEFRGEQKPSLFRAYGLARYYAALGERPEDEVVNFCQGALAESLAGRQWDTLGWFRGKYAWRYGLLGDSALHQFTLRCVNRDLAGALGFLKLCALRGEEGEAAAWGQFARLSVLRFALGKYARYQAEVGLVGLPRNNKIAEQMLAIADFKKPQNFFHQVLELDQHRVTLTNGAAPPEPITFGSYLVPYRDLVPEVGRLLADWGLDEETRVFLAHYAARNPSWYVLFGDAVDGRETPWLFLADMHELFMAHAWIAGTSAEELVRYIDIPYAKVGDLFYMHKLAEAIKALRGTRWRAGK